MSELFISSSEVMRLADELTDLMGVANALLTVLLTRQYFSTEAETKVKRSIDMVREMLSGNTDADALFEGTEGYVEAIASGLYAALNIYARIKGLEAPVLPRTTAFGSLVAYASDADVADYQPMHVNFGVFPPFEQRIRSKSERKAAYAKRGIDDARRFVEQRSDLFLGSSL